MLTRVMLVAFVLFSGFFGDAGDALAQTQTSRTDFINATLKESPGVAGKWVGELTSGAGSATITLRLKQDDGGKVRGDYDASGTAGQFIDRPVVGTFRERKLLLSVPDRAFVGIEATVDGNSMEGTFYGRSGFQALRAKRVDEVSSQK